MINFANKNIRKMKKYSPPLEGRRCYNGRLLDFNERTIPPSKKVIKALTKFINGDQMQLYPEYENINNKIAEYAGVKKDQVMITNGSDQGIDIIFRTYTENGDKVFIPSPSFAMFFQCAQIMGNQVVSSIGRGVKLIVICNPNNPTGSYVSVKDIEKILIKALRISAMVYVDEAYFEFSKITAAGLIDKYPNLIISRTFSKAFGLASLRIGYVLSSAQNIDEMMKIRGPYDISMTAVTAASAALDDVREMEKYVDEVMNRAKPLVEDYFKTNNIRFFPSRANFLLFKMENPLMHSEKLKSLGFLTRPRSGKGIDGTIRVTIGTVSQMKKFINKFKNA
jgi:histidinol-phosphate aminotransferase